MPVQNPPDKPKRLSLSDVLGMVLTRGHQTEGVTLTRARDGATTYEVTSRVRDGETLADAEQRAADVYDRLTEKYASTSGEDTGGGVVDLSRNAKGETQVGVSVRTAEGEDVTDAELRAVDVYDRLRRRFPMSTGYVGASPESGTPESPAEPPADGK